MHKKKEKSSEDILEEIRKNEEEAKEIAMKGNRDFYMYYVKTYGKEPDNVKYHDVEKDLGFFDKMILKNVISRKKEEQPVTIEVIEDGDVQKVPALIDSKNDAVIDVPYREIMTKLEGFVDKAQVNVPTHARFTYNGMYSESLFLKGILDNIIGISPKHKYELLDMEDSKFYKLVIKSVDTDMVTAQFDIDPRFVYGLGIPLIKVPITNGAGTNIFDWVPLGMGRQLCNTLFSNNPMIAIGNIPINDMVIAVHVIKAERELWPDKHLYEFVDMSNTKIDSGEDYQNFGYYLFQVMNTLKNIGISCRFRPEYYAPNKFRLISDNSVQYPDGLQEQRGDIQVTFDGTNLLIESLYDTTKKQTVQVQTVVYPGTNVVPPTFDETIQDIIRKEDAHLVPSPLSEAEKNINAQQQPIQPTNDHSADPNQSVDVLRELGGLINNEGGVDLQKKFFGDLSTSTTPSMATA